MVIRHLLVLPLCFWCYFSAYLMAFSVVVVLFKCLVQRFFVLSLSYMSVL